MRRNWEDNECAGLLLGDGRKPPREEWYRPGVRTVRGGTSCFQLLSFGVGHVVAVNEQIYRRGYFCIWKSNEVEI